MINAQYENCVHWKITFIPFKCIICMNSNVYIFIYALVYRINLYALGLELEKKKHSNLKSMNKHT